MKKSFYLSKTFWACIAAIATGVSLLFDSQINEGVSIIIANIVAIYGRFTANKKLSI